MVASSVIDRKQRCEQKEYGGVPYDLTFKILEYLDTHMSLSIFNFLDEKNVYCKKQLLSAKLDVICKTDMLEFASEVFKLLEASVKANKCENDPVVDYSIPVMLDKKKTGVIDRLGKAREYLLPFLETLEKPEDLEVLKKIRSIGEFEDRFPHLKAAMLPELYDYSKMQFQCGEYLMANELLKHFRILSACFGEDMPEQHEMMLNAIWGGFASSILCSSLYIDTGLDNVMKLDEVLENGRLNLTKQQLLQQKTWLLHWVLFLIFKFEVPPPQEDQADNPFPPPTSAQLQSVRFKLIDFFLSDKNLNVMSITCPHLFRYVAALMILEERFKGDHLEVANLLVQEAHSYSDPVMEFLGAVFVDSDFDKAQSLLSLCMDLLKNDYFLVDFKDNFEHSARLIIFESYCRIHKKIDIDMIAQKLNMAAEEAELWIVKLIDGAHLDAKIDSGANAVVMAKLQPSVYSQVLAKTKNLAFRLTLLHNKSTDKKDVADDLNEEETYTRGGGRGQYNDYGDYRDGKGKGRRGQGGGRQQQQQQQQQSMQFSRGGNRRMGLQDRFIDRERDR